MKILVTGAAGFIGFHTCIKLLNNNFQVVGLDNLNNYYDVKLKYSRLEEINKNAALKKQNWKFIKTSLENEKLIFKTFNEFNPDVVIHLAAQAGVRYSLENPKSYIDSNLLGFFNIIEACRKFNVKNFLFASSSSVYGGNKNLPFNEIDSVDHPVSLYAATKKSNEIIAHSYSHLFNIPSTGLRFFTVYGPWGRPDMAPMIFAKAILEGKPIEVFNHGNMKRDFTYIDDVVEAILKCCFKPASIYPNFDSLNPEPSKSFAPHRILNIGNGNPLDLLLFIDILEKALGKKTTKIMKDMHNADVQETFADKKQIEEWIGFKTNTSIEKGIEKFADWYINYYFK